MNGRGPQRAQLCVVKAKLDRFGSPEDWEPVQEVVRRATALATSFNVLVNARVISFLWPKVAELSTVSDFTPLIRIFKKHDKRLMKEEMVVIEDFLEVGFILVFKTMDLFLLFFFFLTHLGCQS